MQIIKLRYGVGARLWMVRLLMRSNRLKSRPPFLVGFFYHFLENYCLAVLMSQVGDALPRKKVDMLRGGLLVITPKPYALCALPIWLHARAGRDGKFQASVARIRRRPHS